MRAKAEGQEYQIHQRVVVVSRADYDFNEGRGGLSDAYALLVLRRKKVSVSAQPIGFGLTKFTQSLRLYVNVFSASALDHSSARLRPFRGMITYHLC